MQLKAPDQYSYEYESQKEDVFTVATLEDIRRKERDHAMQYIRQKCPNQYYLIQRRELSSQQKKLDQQEKAIIRLPLVKSCNPLMESKKRVRRNASKRSIRMRKTHIKRKTKQLYQVQSSELSSKNTANRVKLNGVYWGYADLCRLIRRPIQNDEPADAELNLCDTYIQFRLKETKQDIILKHNWSGNDVLLQLPLSTKKKYFRALNKIDICIWLTGYSGLWTVCKKYLVQALRTPSLLMFFDICIFVNILFLSLTGILSERIIWPINNIITILLLIELFMKIITTEQFFSKKVNQFESLIIMICVSEIILKQMLSERLSSYFQLMRGFMAILFYRIIKYSPFAVKIMHIAEKTLPSYISLILLMFVMIFIYALFGMEIFANKFD